MPVWRDLRVLLRYRNFRRLLAVRLLSQGADGVYQIALATYVVFSPEKQTSAAAIASAMAVLLLPYSVVGPFAGRVIVKLTTLSTEPCAMAFIDSRPSSASRHVPSAP